MKCNCKRGFSLCPEAERLWVEVRKYTRLFDKKSEVKYKKALDKYNHHFKETENV